MEMATGIGRVMRRASDIWGWFVCGCVGASAHGAAPPPSEADVVVPAAVDALLRAHCLDCHTGPRSKANLDLADRVHAKTVSPTLLASLRARLAREDMPPDSVDERPAPAEYASTRAVVAR